MITDFHSNVIDNIDFGNHFTSLGSPVIYGRNWGGVIPTGER